MTIAQWKERLEDRVGALRTIDETLFARTLYDQGLSVNRAEDAINAKRKGLVH